jgi:hypothetical protein
VLFSLTPKLCSAARLVGAINTIYQRTLTCLPWKLNVLAPTVYLPCVAYNTYRFFIPLFKLFLLCATTQAPVTYFLFQTSFTCDACGYIMNIFCKKALCVHACACSTCELPSHLSLSRFFISSSSCFPLTSCFRCLFYNSFSYFQVITCLPYRDVKSHLLFGNFKIVVEDISTIRNCICTIFLYTHKLSNVYVCFSMKYLFHVSSPYCKTKIII